MGLSRGCQKTKMKLVDLVHLLVHQENKTIQKIINRLKKATQIAIVSNHILPYATKAIVYTSKLF